MIGTNKKKFPIQNNKDKKSVYLIKHFKDLFESWKKISYYSNKKLKIYKIIYKLQKHVSIGISLLAVLSK